MSCYILADTFFVSKGLGINGLTALNLTIPVYNFSHGTGLMLGMGGATIFSVCKSQGRAEEVNRIYANTIYLALLFSVAFVLLGFVFFNQLAILLGADASVLEMTNTYLRWLFIFAPGLSPIISIIMMLPHWIRKRNTFYFVKTKIEASIVKQDLSLGFPSLIAQLSSGIVMIVFNAIILNLEGNTGVAAYRCFQQ